MTTLSRDVLELIERLDAALLQRPQTLPVSVLPRLWTPEDASMVRSHYRTLLQNNAQNLSAACDWGERAEQERLLNDLFEVGPLRGARILDVGCGAGGLLQALRANAMTPGSYTGVDVSEELLHEARTLFPGVEFLAGDCFAEHLPDELTLGDYDYVVMSGIFGVRPRTWSEAEFNGLLLRVVTRFFGLAKKALAFNVIPTNYPMLKSLLDLKADTEFVAYHRVSRLGLLADCRNIAPGVSTLPNTLERLMVQFPVFLQH